MLTFWEAYAKFRTTPPPKRDSALRAEEVAVLVECSVHAVNRWDTFAKATKPSQRRKGRNPSHFNRVRLSRAAKELGFPEKVVDALAPEPQAEAHP